MQIEAQIRQFILQHLYFVEDQTLQDTDSFLAAGIVDSMGVMELVAFVQSTYGITVDQPEIIVENFDSIRKVANFVRRKLAARLPPAPVVGMAALERSPAGKS